MKKIFAINGGKIFAHSQGRFNKTILALDEQFFTKENGYELITTDINSPYELEEEVEKFVWADVIIYHFPVWWFSMPYALKEYIDKVFTAGHRKGMYRSDGRKSDNPAINYGTGGLLDGRKYMVTTTWNAPKTAFTLPGEFFDQKNVDEGVLFGFHRMNAFLSLTPLESMHFHDVEKNNSLERVEIHKSNYLNHLNKVLQPQNQ